ncbi:MAG: hypothetical protein WDN26_05285 [Chitinophagaceae bacterium]
MTQIEKKIKNNKQIFEERFVRRSEYPDIINNNAKIEFRPSWDNGWDNGKSFRPIIRTSGNTLPGKK